MTTGSPFASASGRRVDFSAEDVRAWAEVGDGIVGPAGLASFDVGGLELEFDRVDGRLLAIAVGLDDEASPPWAQLVPDLDLLREAEGARRGVRVNLPEPLLEAASRTARIDADLSEVAARQGGERVTAFEVAALFELVPLLAIVEQWVPGAAGGPRGLEAIAERAQAAFWKLGTALLGARDKLLDPLTGRGQAFARLVELASAVVPIDPRMTEAVEGRRAEVARSSHPAPGAPEEAVAGGRFILRGLPRNGLPRAPLDGSGQFTVDSAVVGEGSQGFVERVPDTDDYRVELFGAAQAAPELGPLWVRLYAGSKVVGGGPLERALDGTAAVVVPVPSGVAPDAVETWVNPYRYPTPESLVRPRAVHELAAQALAAGRTALLWSWPVPDAARWRSAAEAWLAAGYLDRAALALGLAEDDDRWLWVRSVAAQARLVERRPIWQPAAMAWLR